MQGGEYAAPKCPRIFYTAPMIAGISLIPGKTAAHRAPYSKKTFFSQRRGGSPENPAAALFIRREVERRILHDHPGICLDLSGFGNAVCAIGSGHDFRVRQGPVGRLHSE